VRRGEPVGAEGASVATAQPSAAGARASGVPSKCACGAPCPDPSCRFALPGGRCALAIAEEGPHEFGEIARLLGDCSPSRVAQIARGALVKLRRTPGVDVLAEFLDP
jgi:hypothetical protein